jgi:hypothetical protein
MTIYFSQDTQTVRAALNALFLFTDASFDEIHAWGIKWLQDFDDDDNITSRLEADGFTVVILSEEDFLEKLKNAAEINFRLQIDRVNDEEFALQTQNKYNLDGSLAAWRANALFYDFIFDGHQKLQKAVREKHLKDFVTEHSGGSMEIAEVQFNNLSGAGQLCLRKEHHMVARINAEATAFFGK